MKKYCFLALASIVAPLLSAGCSDSYQPVIRHSDQPKIVFTRVAFNPESGNNSTGQQVVLTDEFGDAPKILDTGSIVSSPHRGLMIWSHIGTARNSVIVADSNGTPIRELLPAGGSASFLDGHNATISYDATRVSYTVNGIQLMESEIDGSGVQQPCYSVMWNTLGSIGPNNTRNAYYHDMGIKPDSTTISQYLFLHYKKQAPGMDTCGDIGRGHPYWKDKTAIAHWSNDGKVVIFSYDSALYRSTRKWVPFTLGFSGVISPDNSKVAYTTLDGDINIFTIDDSSFTPVTVATPEFDAYPQWSPDGSRILFTSFAVELDRGAGTLKVYSVKERTITPIYTPAYKGFWVQ